MSTKKLLTDNKSHPARKLNINPKQQLVARWKKVDGKLICQWVTALKIHDTTPTEE